MRSRRYSSNTQNILSGPLYLNTRRSVLSDIQTPRSDIYKTLLGVFHPLSKHEIQEIQPWSGNKTLTQRAISWGVVSYFRCFTKHWWERFIYQSSFSLDIRWKALCFFSQKNNLRFPITITLPFPVFDTGVTLRVKATRTCLPWCSLDFTSRASSTRWSLPSLVSQNLIFADGQEKSTIITFRVGQNQTCVSC